MNTRATNSPFRRVIVPQRYLSEEISSGVRLEKFQPGGIQGPNGEVFFKTPGGQTYSEQVHVGGESDAFQLGISHVRMPPNQYWPLHWHDAVTVVLCLEGTCLIGDWWMDVGDILVVDASLEYGPLVAGPAGCRLFEIFNKAHLTMGGYAPEYHDHPTLQSLPMPFIERSPLNKHNNGNQILSCDGPGLVKSHLSPGMRWDLGEANDPERGVMKATKLGPNERLPAHRYGDWHFLMVQNGSITVSGKTLGVEDYLLIKPNSTVGEIQAGPNCAEFLHTARTSRGSDPQFVA
jgi:hypothetical protein